MGTGGAGRPSGGGYDLEEIRRRADIVEIISPHVALRKAGRRLVGLCPFHQERTPSFTLDPETGLWHCFGCKAGGDLFRFVELIEKVSFAEAVELLARRLGVTPRRPADAARQQERERLLDLHRAACEFFQSHLRAQAGRRARAYLDQRGLSAESRESFALGYAPDGWDALLITMGRRGYSGQELARAGLAVPREGGFYDRFRDRLIFPIWDPAGRVIAFGGRALSDEQTPKYLNSPDTPLFQKGRVLYAFDRARQAMGESGQAIVVEGYLDVIACHEAGFVQTVATMGTALTPEHVELLRRRVAKLVLAFDADSAGLAAALRGRELFQQAGLSVRVVSLPEGLDPDGVIRERGSEAFGELVRAAVPMVEWELRRLLEPLQGAAEEARMEGMRQAVAVLARLPAGVEREYYIRWLAQQWAPDVPSRIASLEAALRDELARLGARKRVGERRTGPLAPAQGAVNKQAPASAGGLRMTSVQSQLLAAFIRHGDLAARYGPQLQAEDFAPPQRSIFAAVRSLMQREEGISAQSVLTEVGPEAREELAKLIIADVPEERVEESVASAVGRLIEGRLLRRETRLREQLAAAQSVQERETILRELSEARRQRSQLAGQRLVGEP
jgi:DNA primase